MATSKSTTQSSNRALPPPRLHSCQRRSTSPNDKSSSLSLVADIISRRCVRPISPCPTNGRRLAARLTRGRFLVYTCSEKSRATQKMAIFRTTHVAFTTILKPDEETCAMLLKTLMLLRSRCRAVGTKTLGHHNLRQVAAGF